MAESWRIPDGTLQAWRKPISKNEKVEPSKISKLNLMGSSYSGADIQIIVHSSAKEVIEQDRAVQLAALEEEEQKLIEEFGDGPAKRGSRTGLNRIQAQKDELARQPTPPESVILATAQTLSIQTFRAKKAVRALGAVSPKGIARGSRTLGGSIIFTVFDEHALAELLHYPPTMHSYEKLNGRGGFKAYPDQLPPLTITALFANEYGSVSELSIYGVEFVTDGQVMSIEDIFSETTTSFIATDYNVLLSRGRADLRLDVPLGSPARLAYPTSGSSLLYGSEYRDYQKRLGVQRDPYS